MCSIKNVHVFTRKFKITNLQFSTTKKCNNFSSNVNYGPISIKLTNYLISAQTISHWNALLQMPTTELLCSFFTNKIELNFLPALNFSKADAYKALNKTIVYSIKDTCTK